MIESDALACAIDEAHTLATHRRLLELWMQFGVLVYSPRNLRFIDAINAQPLARRKLWQAAVASPKFRKVHCEAAVCDSLFEGESEILSLASQVDLVCLEPTRACAYYLENDEHGKIYPQAGMEICRFDCADQSSAFSKEKEAWQQMIYVGCPRSTVWETRFEGLSLHAQHISIVDRYASLNLVERHHAGKASGFEIFLRLLNGLDSNKTRKKTISFFVSDLAPTDDVVAIIRRTCGSLLRNITSLVLFSAPDHQFKRVAHDRFFRFDGLVTSVGRGLALFEEPEITANFSCSLAVDRQGDFERNVERVLRPASRMRSVFDFG
ncbi:hypothetical protein [Falsiroseomonas sp. E2-1-a4]|uniref:hypothetical protein n=1 Tax=Falsiroseomonas sp. E2-1-a4 TaxID=3239299 RepID=UPI003F2D1879